MPIIVSVLVWQRVGQLGQPVVDGFICAPRMLLSFVAAAQPNEANKKMGRCTVLFYCVLDIYHSSLHYPAAINNCVGPPKNGFWIQFSVILHNGTLCIVLKLAFWASAKKKVCDDEASEQSFWSNCWITQRH